VRAALVVAALAAQAHAAFTFHDPRIDEASGLGLGHRSPGVAYVQNDSGDANRFFAVNLRTGRTAATITVRGATNVDWEDLAVAPDADGVWSVWLADIGDNGAGRGEVDVYRVPEPKVAAAASNVSITTPPASVWRLRYPDGPVNAESFAVTPAGVGYIVTKVTSGRSAVYRLPAQPDPDHVQTLTRVARVRFPSTLAYGREATGAAISADGRWLAVRTYLDAYFWRLRGGNVPAALAARPTEVGLPLQLQGEGIALAPGRFYLDTEGRHSAVQVVPYAPLKPPPPPSSSEPDPSRATVTFSKPAPSSPAPAVPGRGDGWVGKWVLAVLAIAALAAAVEYRRRGGRRDG